MDTNAYGTNCNHVDTNMAADHLNLNLVVGGRERKFSFEPRWLRVPSLAFPAPFWHALPAKPWPSYLVAAQYVPETFLVNSLLLQTSPVLGVMREAPPFFTHRFHAQRVGQWGLGRR